jgi:hypothetical protein
LLGEIRKEKKEREREREKWPGFFSPGPGAGHTLLAVLGRIFAAVGCN